MAVRPGSLKRCLFKARFYQFEALTFVVPLHAQFCSGTTSQPKNAGASSCWQVPLCVGSVIAKALGVTGVEIDGVMCSELCWLVAAQGREIPLSAAVSQSGCALLLVQTSV